MSIEKKLNYILTNAQDLRRAETETAKEMFEHRIQVAIKEIEDEMKERYWWEYATKETI